MEKESLQKVCQTENCMLYTAHYLVQSHNYSTDNLGLDGSNQPNHGQIEEYMYSGFKCG